jgi:hypothetical protein
MDGNPVESFDPGELWKLIDETRREKNFGGGARRAVRTDEFERLAPTNDLCYPRPAHRDGLVAGEFFQRFVQEIRGRPPFPSEQPVNCVRA